MIIMDRRWTVPNTNTVATQRVKFTLLFVVVLLLSTLCASFGRARDYDAQKRFDDGKETRKEGNDFVVDDPFRANACLDAELYCKQTIAPAVEQDATLRQFLRDARKDARTMHSWDTIIVPKAMKTPETLAMGTTTRAKHITILHDDDDKEYFLEPTTLSPRRFFSSSSSHRGISFSLSFSLDDDDARASNRMLPSLWRVRDGSRRADCKPETCRAYARRSVKNGGEN